MFEIFVALCLSMVIGAAVGLLALVGELICRVFFKDMLEDYEEE